MTIKTWKHGDTDVSAANLTEYSTALTAAHTLLGDTAQVYAVHLASSAFFHIWHTHRYLWFKSAGQIVSIDGANTVGLSEPTGGGTGMVDLDTLDWLQYGQLYTVSGVSACIEDYE